MDSLIYNLSSEWNYRNDIVPAQILITNDSKWNDFNSLRNRNPETKLIAYSYWGDYQPFGRVKGKEHEKNWDSNKDGIPDEGAPSWFGPVNTGWTLPLTHPGNYYADIKGKHPSYNVRFWDETWLSYIKSYITELSNNKWDGIFLDVIWNPNWLVETEVNKETYTPDELKNYTYQSLKSLKEYINQNHPEFDLYINGTNPQSFLINNESLLTFVDGLLFENAHYWNVDMSKNIYPTNAGLDDIVSENQLIFLQDEIKKYNPNIILGTDDDVENDDRIFCQIARRADKFNLIPNINYDNLERINQNGDTTSYPQILSQVDIEKKDILTNKYDMRSIMIGLEGNDTLYGSFYDEILMGGIGDDTLFGSDGSDIAVYKYNYNSYKFNRLNPSLISVETKEEFKNLHELDLEINTWEIAGENVSFTLEINNKSYLIDSKIITNDDKKIKYTINEKIKSIIVHHTNHRYDPITDSSNGIAINSISIDDNEVDLSAASFIDGKETWAGYSEEYDTVNIGKGRVEIDVETYNIKKETEGKDLLYDIEKISFLDQIVDIEKVDKNKDFDGHFKDYKFYKQNNGVYQIKTYSGFDDITGLPLLTFTGEAETSSFRNISTITDIQGTFDQVTGLNTDSGEMFRLYNAAFGRFPDADGLKYWIDQFSSGRNTRRVVAQSFLGSEEFIQRYGSNISNETYVNNLYKNVLGRDADTEGLNYWLGNLSNEIETRYEVLLGFAESAENKALFTEMTGFG